MELDPHNFAKTGSGKPALASQSKALKFKKFLEQDNHEKSKTLHSQVKIGSQLRQTFE